MIENIEILRAIDRALTRLVFALVAVVGTWHGAPVIGALL